MDASVSGIQTIAQQQQLLLLDFALSQWSDVTVFAESLLAQIQHADAEDAIDWESAFDQFVHSL